MHPKVFNIVYHITFLANIIIKVLLLEEYFIFSFLFYKQGFIILVEIFYACFVFSSAEYFLL